MTELDIWKDNKSEREIKSRDNIHTLERIDEQPPKKNDYSFIHWFDLAMNIFYQLFSLFSIHSHSIQ